MEVIDRVLKDICNEMKNRKDMDERCVFMDDRRCVQRIRSRRTPQPEPTMWDFALSLGRSGRRVTEQQTVRP